MSRNVAVLFADICDSTGLYQNAGDTAACDLNGRCLEQLMALTRRYQGTIIRTEGDGILSTFPSADAAFCAAVDMQQTPYAGGLRIKIGFHLGPALRGVRGDVYGDAVNVAARLASRAQASEILLGAEVAEALSPRNRAIVFYFDTVYFKGRQQPVIIHKVRYQHEEQTATINLTQAMSSRQQGCLVLNHQGDEMLLEGLNRRWVIGRAEDCDLVLNGQYCSRRHAVIEIQRDRYMLTDQSSNGTFVINQDQETCFLKRESVQLLGIGVIAFGGLPTVPGISTVQYRYQS